MAEAMELNHGVYVTGLTLKLMSSSHSGTYRLTDWGQYVHGTGQQLILFHEQTG